MKKLLISIASLLMAAGLQAQTTTYTGTIKDLALNPVTSGQVTFTLTPSTDSTLSGTGRFTPSTITCNIQGDGTLSASGAGVVGACKVVSNTALSPAGTSYRICIQPNFLTPGSCFYDYATTTTKDISTVAPTLSTGPLNYNGVPGPPIPFFGTWSSTTTYVVGQSVAYNNSVYISLTHPNLNNTPSSSPANWSVVVAPASVLAAPSGTQNIVQPSGTSFNVNTTQTGSANGVLNPATCSTANAPSWCAGTDMGAWVNAAIAAMPGDASGRSFGCGVVQLPYNSNYDFTTPIVKPRCTLIDLNMSSIGYTGDVAFPAISIWDTFAIGEPANGGIINGRIFGGNGATPIVAGSIGVFMGGLLTKTTGYCFADNTSDCSATFQTFSNLVVQNFTDGYRVASNSFTNNWNSATVAGNTNGIHFIPGNNSGENENFHAPYFVNNQSHDIVVDPTAYAEVDIHGGSFDYSSGDSIVGPIHLSMTDTHSENNNLHWHFLNCGGGGCSINIKGGQILNLGTLSSTDSFGVFSGTGNQATFDGVEWGILSGQVLSQFFVWNDSSAISSLHLLNFRQAIFGNLSTNPNLRYVSLYSGTAPPQFQSNSTDGAQSIPTTSGDVVIASGAVSIGGIYTIDFSEANFRSTMTVSVDATGSDASYSLFVLESYGFNASSGTNFRNIVNPRVVMDAAGFPQLVVTLVNVVSGASPTLTAVRYGTPKWTPQLLSGAAVGPTPLSMRNGMLQDALGNISVVGTLNTTQGFLPPAGSTAPTGACTVIGQLVITADGHGTSCSLSNTWVERW